MAAPVAVLACAGAALTASEPPGWLGWCPPWALAAAGAVPAVLSTWLVRPWATRRRQADADRDALGELARHLGRSTWPPLLSEIDPLGQPQPCGCTGPSRFPQTGRWAGPEVASIRGCLRWASRPAARCWCAPTAFRRPPRTRRVGV